MDSTLAAAIVGGGALIFVEIGKVVIKYYEKKNQRKKANNDLNRATDNDVLIKSICAEIIERFGFNRVSVVGYHNGVQTMDGISLKKCSMIQEVTDGYTDQIIGEFQNIPCSIAAEMLKELKETPDGYVIADDESAVEETAIHQRMFNVRQSYNFRIGEGLIDGVLCCAFTGQTRIFEHEEILELKAYAKRIFVIKQKQIK